MMMWLVNWPPFDWVIIITIIANCVVMSMDDKLSNDDKSIMSLKLVSYTSKRQINHAAADKLSFYLALFKFQEELEIIFMVVFTTEMCSKILALGFMLHKGSYMRNPWNFMDFFVVTSG